MIFDDTADLTWLNSALILQKHTVSEIYPQFPLYIALHYFHHTDILYIFHEFSFIYIIFHACYLHSGCVATPFHCCFTCTVMQINRDLWYSSSQLHFDRQWLTQQNKRLFFNWWCVCAHPHSVQWSSIPSCVTLDVLLLHDCVCHLQWSRRPWTTQSGLLHTPKKYFKVCFSVCSF